MLESVSVYFGIKIRQCDYCLDSFVCSFMVAPYVGDVVRDDLDDFEVKNVIGKSTYK